MNEIQKEALKKVYKALGEFILLLAEDEQTDEQTQAGLPSAEPETNIQEIEKPVKEKAEPEKFSDTEKGVNGYSRKELLEIGFNGMKKLAKELGLTPKGSREDIVNLLLNEKGKEARSITSTTAVSPRGKKVKVTPKEEEPEEVDTDTDSGDDDNLEAVVIEATKDMSDEELADYLVNEGIKNVKGKRQTLIALAVKAIRAGDLELSDEEENDTEKEQEEEPESDNDSSDTTDDTDSGDDVEFDIEEINNPDNPEMTRERATAIGAYSADLQDQFDNGDFTKEDMLNYINDYYGGNTTVADEDILKTYINIACLFIDDDGDMPEEDAEPNAYYVNGVVFCCGYPCKWDEENSTYICEFCGHEYPVE